MSVSVCLCVCACVRARACVCVYVYTELAVDVIASCVTRFGNGNLISALINKYSRAIDFKGWVYHYFSDHLSIEVSECTCNEGLKRRVGSTFTVRILAN